MVILNGVFEPRDKVSLQTCHLALRQGEVPMMWRCAIENFSWRFRCRRPKLNRPACVRRVSEGNGWLALYFEMKEWVGWVSSGNSWRQSVAFLATQDKSLLVACPTAGAWSPPSSPADGGPSVGLSVLWGVMGCGGGWTRSHGLILSRVCDKLPACVEGLRAQ